MIRLLQADQNKGGDGKREGECALDVISWQFKGKGITLVLKFNIRNYEKHIEIIVHVSLNKRIEYEKDKVKWY